MLKDYWTGDLDSGERSIEATWDNYWNATDENLRRAYRNNLKQLFYDLFMLFFLGLLVTPALVNATKEHVKDTDNRDFMTAMSNNAMLNTAYMLKSSTNDFNMFSSIFGKGM